MNFISLDVETANSDHSSICQIGIVQFNAGSPKVVFESLINPMSRFSSYNTRIHKIRRVDVAQSPTFLMVYPDLQILLTDKIVVHHAPFDLIAIRKACQAHNLPLPSCIWLDTLKVTRRIWADLPNHRLKTIAETFGINFRHHNATEDARVAGEILVRAMNETNTALEDWIKKLDLKSA